MGLLCAAVLAASGCVDPFRGSNIQVAFGAGVPAAAAEGTTPPPGTPPANTFLSFYAVELVFERDDDGTIVTDAMGEPVVVDSHAFHVNDFEIRPLIDLASPCFIEVENTEFPGLHVTQFANRIRAETGIDDPLNPPSGADPGAITDVLDADRRMEVLPLLQGGVKAVTSKSNFRYPELADACIEDGGEPARIPPITCTGEESNRVRLELCEQIWRDNPELYEGNDKVFTIPLAGEFFGTVEGFNPINSGFIGGAGMFVDEVLSELDSLLINFQFKDLDGDGEPDYPPETQEREKSDIGFLFMQGVPVKKARGVINVPLSHPTVGTIVGEAVIVPELGGDDVNF